ncbi:hypothetical protein EVAR_50058_1 [Eumeta japonica]|uniref:Uncharacterized protein n=1 Tax=Eumeta variegata TaxID=151549 RepID=A0A4C1XLG9_EUMVA|nr:hypothetical protein EVAR_50058_1 [Eumeta japonica]
MSQPSADCKCQNLHCLHALYRLFARAHILECPLVTYWNINIKAPVSEAEFFIEELDRRLRDKRDDLRSGSYLFQIQGRHLPTRVGIFVT